MYSPEVLCVVHIYIYIYMCVCVCACVYIIEQLYKHTHNMYV